MGVRLQLSQFGRIKGVRYKNAPDPFSPFPKSETCIIAPAPWRNRRANIDKQGRLEVPEGFTRPGSSFLDNAAGPDEAQLIGVKVK